MTELSPQIVPSTGLALEPGWIAVAWVVALFMTVASAMAVVIVAYMSQSARLTTREQVLDLGRLRSAALARLRAQAMPGRNGAWNTLVRDQDEARLKARVTARQRSTWVLTLAALSGLALAAAAAVTAGANMENIARAGEVSGSQALTVVALIFVAAYGWEWIPFTADWVLRHGQRKRATLSWRLLEKGSMIRSLVDPRRRAELGPEAVVDGHVSTPHAAFLLREFEDVIINAMSPSKHARPSDHVRWRTLDAPRLSLVLASKARLLDDVRGEVRVDDILTWIDQTVSELVKHGTSSRKLKRVDVEPGLIEGDQKALTDRRLRLRFRDHPAAACCVAAVLCLVGLLLANTYSDLRSVLGPYPDISGALASIGAIGLAAVLGPLATRWFRSSADS